MANIVVYFLILLHISLSFDLTQSAPKGSLITKVPGFNNTLPSKHYAGYVTVDEKHGRNLYYYFVVSEGKPSKDPVVLWLNGGPGCSSFYGFIYEHGPFKFEKPKTKGTLPTLQLNPYSWSKVSNIIYLDSPAGVGFSNSKNESDYKTGDVKTASDTHTFLLKWFELYPEFLSNPLFISGESYGGIYVPTLAQKIVEGIEGGKKPSLNFKGYMIGNALTDNNFDFYSTFLFAHGMGLLNDDLFEVLGGLNPYNILEPCYDGGVDHKKPNSWPLRAPLKNGIVPTWPQLNTIIPCTIHYQI
ncbi:Serine carboxypeptidase, serine active site [Sesbania bispinosa]|nr:Serine carboxypeptidase, serine active site [Sesbania bispinosa]